MRYAFLILAIMTGIAGTFGTTPAGEPATHQFYLSAACMIVFLAIKFQAKADKAKDT